MVIFKNKNNNIHKQKKYTFCVTLIFVYFLNNKIFFQQRTPSLIFFMIAIIF